MGENEVEWTCKAEIRKAESPDQRDQWLGAEQDQLPCGSAGTSSGNCQETETCTVWVYHTLRQPLQNHPSGQRKCWMDNIKEWTSLTMPELPTTVSCRKDLKRISAELSVMSSRRPNRSWDWTELNAGTNSLTRAGRQERKLRQFLG